MPTVVEMRVCSYNNASLDSEFDDASAIVMFFGCMLLVVGVLLFMAGYDFQLSAPAKKLVPLDKDSQARRNSV